MSHSEERWLRARFGLDISQFLGPTSLKISRAKSICRVTLDQTQSRIWMMRFPGKAVEDSNKQRDRGWKSSFLWNWRCSLCQWFSIQIGSWPLADRIQRPWSPLWRHNQNWLQNLFTLHDMLVLALETSSSKVCARRAWKMFVIQQQK